LGEGREDLETGVRLTIWRLKPQRLKNSDSRVTHLRKLAKARKRLREGVERSRRNENLTEVTVAKDARMSN